VSSLAAACPDDALQQEVAVLALGVWIPGPVISIVPREWNRDLGGSLPWRNRPIGSYPVQPAAGHDRTATGINGLPRVRYARFPQRFMNPFEKGERSRCPR